MKRSIHQKKDDWKKIWKNDMTIALNVLYARKGKIYSSYVSKHNSNRKKQVIILMISNRDKECKYKSKGPMAKSEDGDGIIL